MSDTGVFQNVVVDTLAGMRTSKSPLYSSLYGLGQSLKHHLGLEACSLVMHDNPKAIQRKIRNDLKKYPFAYFRLNSLGINTDRQNVKQIARNGANMGFNRSTATNNLMAKSYLFPVVAEIEFHYLANQVQDIIAIAEQLTILFRMEALSFRVDLDVAEWTVRVYTDNPDISIPVVSLEDENEPQAADITLNFRIEAWAGTFKDVVKINNEGIVQQQFTIQTDQDT